MSLIVFGLFGVCFCFLMFSLVVVVEGFFFGGMFVLGFLLYLCFVVGVCNALLFVFS